MTAVMGTRASATPRLHPDSPDRRTGGVGHAFICSSMLHPFTSSGDLESAWARPWLHATCNNVNAGPSPTTKGGTVSLDLDYSMCIESHGQCEKCYVRRGWKRNV